MDDVYYAGGLGEKEVNKMGQIEIFKVNTLVMKFDYQDQEINERYLKIGKGYFTYMRFNLSRMNHLNKVMKAQLILFKVPIEQSKNHRMDWKYKVVPLLDYVNVCGQCYMRPRGDEVQAVFFKDNADMGYLEIDLTNIVNEWLSGKIENKGILIAGRRGSNLLKFAGPKDDMKLMRPFLRVTYEIKVEGTPMVRPSTIPLPNQVTIIKS